MNKKKQQMNFKNMIQTPSQKQRLEQNDYFTWGGSVIKGDDGLYHLFFSQWKKEYTFFGWLTKSEIARAEATSIEGPYTIKETLHSLTGQDWAKKMVHNPTIKKIGEKYYLYYIGTTYDDEIPETPDDFGGKFDVIDHPARYNQKIGVAIADSVNGPFIPSEQNPILDKREGEWDSTFVCNPSIFEEANGKIKMIYKAKLETEEVLILGAAESEKPEGPFKRVGPSPLFDYDIEDPFIWKQKETYFMLAKDMSGAVSGKYNGILFESPDGLNFTISENKQAWDHKITYTDREEENPLFVERPQLYIENDEPICLFTAISNNRTHSYNLARLLKKEDN